MGSKEPNASQRVVLSSYYLHSGLYNIVSLEFSTFGSSVLDFDVNY